MAKVNAQEFTEKWGRNLKNSVTDIERGVDRVTEAPGRKAAQQVEAYRQGILTNIQKWQQRVAAVSLEDWREAMKNKGVGRIAAGVDGATSKVEAAAQTLLANVDAVNAEIANMPTNTVQDRINKSAAFQMKMHERSSR